MARDISDFFFNSLLLLSTAYSLLFSQHVQAQIDVNSSYTFTGSINIDSLDVFENALKSKKIKTVIFTDCDGGNLAAGLSIARLIKINELNTIASGKVLSSCAFAYLGGVSRIVDASKKNNAIKFHGGRNIQTDEPLGLALNQSALKLLFEFTDFKFNKTIEDIILNTKSDDEGVIFLRFQGGGKIRDMTVYCPPGVNMKPEKCKKLDGITLESEGIVTK